MGISGSSGDFGAGVGQEIVIRLQLQSAVSDNYMGLLLGNRSNTISAKTKLFWGIQYLLVLLLVTTL